MRPKTSRAVGALVVAIVVMQAAVASAIVKQQQATSGQQQPSSASASSASVSSSQSSSASAPSSPSVASSVVASPSSVASSSSASQQQQRSDEQSSQVQSQQFQVPKVASSSSGSSGYQLGDSLGQSEQSYQAAAQSVNSALASSGLFGNFAGAGSHSGYQQGAGNQQLSPLHYFYYPSSGKQQDQQVAQQQQQKSQPMDLMSSSSQVQPQQQPLQTGNSYYSSNPAPSSGYYDQYSSSIGVPEAAASSQDLSYLAATSSTGSQQQPQASQQDLASPGLYSSGQDLGAYASQAQPQQASLPGGTVSFQVQPQASQQQQQGNPQQAAPQQQQYPNGAQPDYLSQPGNQQQPQQQLQQQPQQQQASHGGYQGSSQLYSQLSDLSTSNYGSQPNQLASVASYLAPSSPQQVSQQQQQQLFGQQHPSQSQDLFSLASSQPQQVSGSQQQHPSVGQQQPQTPSIASLYNQAASLFGPQAAIQSASQPHQSFAQFAQQSAQQYTPTLGSQFGFHQLQADPSQGGLMSSGSSHSATSLAANGGSKRGISSYIMPLLALAGLSMLIPTMSNIGTAVGRKKRSIANDKASLIERQQQILYDSINGMGQLAKETSIGEYMDKIERYYAIYKNAAENQDCMNRLICEFGDSVKDMTGKSAIITVIEKLVPAWMTGKMHLFKEAAMDRKEGAEKCKKYTCHNPKRYSSHSEHHAML